MAKNVFRGPLRYGKKQGFVPSAAAVKAGKLRVYWGPTQKKSSRLYEVWSAQGSAAYVPPTGWPAAGQLLKMPKVVYFLYSSTFPGVTRLTAWRAVAAALTMALAPYELTVFNDFRLGDVATWPSYSLPNYKALVQLVTPLTADCVSGGFVGTDVLFIIVEQDFGFSAYNAYDQSFNPTYITSRAAQFQSDVDVMKLAYPEFRRLEVWLYHDEDTIAYSPGSTSNGEENYAFGYGNTGMTGWNDVQTYWQTYKSDILAGNSPYNRVLQNYGWSYKGLAGYTTATAQTFLPGIKMHFGLT